METINLTFVIDYIETNNSLSATVCVNGETFEQLFAMKADKQTLEDSARRAIDFFIGKKLKKVMNNG